VKDRFRSPAEACHKNFDVAESPEFSRVSITNHAASQVLGIWPPQLSILITDKFYALANPMPAR